MAAAKQIPVSMLSGFLGSGAIFASIVILLLPSDTLILYAEEQQSL